MSYYKTNEAENAMAVVASWISKNPRIKVEYHNGKAVDADIFTGRIRIPRLACASGLQQEGLMLLRGQVYHEGKHIDSTVLAKSEYPKGALFTILNGLEDRRIEAEGSAEHLGCKMVFSWMNNYYNKKIAGQIVGGEVNAPLWEALCAMGFMVDGILPAWKLTDKAQVYFDAAYAEFSKVRQAKDTKACLELARKIYDLLKQTSDDFNKQQEQKPEQKKSEQKKQDKSDKGKGKQDKSEEGEDGSDGEGSGAAGDMDDSEKDGEGSDESDDKADKKDSEKKDKKSKGKGKDSEEDSDEESDEESEGSGKGKKSDEESDEESDDDAEGSGEGSDEESDEESDDDGEGSGKGSDEGSDIEDETGDDGKGNESGEGSEEGADGDAESKADDSEAGESVGSSDSNEGKDGAYKPDNSGKASLAKTGIEEEISGPSITEIMNERLEKIFDDMPDVDKDYLACRDKDEHTVPPATLADKSVFAERRGKIGAAVSSMTHALAQALRSLAKSRKNPYLRQGKIDKKRLVAITKGLSKEVFFKTQSGVELDVAVEIVVDESGSMGNYYDVQLMLIAIGESLSQIGVPFEITGTTTRGRNYGVIEDTSFTRYNPIVYKHYKNFSEQWVNVRQRICYTGAHNNNVDGEAVEYAAFRLAQRKESRKVIFSLSDGQPCAGQGNDGEMCANLKRVCQRVRKAGIEVYGFGIGTEAPKAFYGEKFFVYLEDVASMGQEFIKKFVDVITAGKVKV